MSGIDSSIVQQALGGMAQNGGSTHYCTSFTHVKTRTVKVASIAAEHGNWQVYQCTECGRQTGFYDKDDSIENIIAENKRKQALESQSRDVVNAALQGISTEVTVPAGSAQGGGYSSEIMDQIRETFAEQGPCSAGLQLEALKNQNK